MHDSRPFLDAGSNIVLFGGLGFLGEHLLALFRRRGFPNISVVTRNRGRGNAWLQSYADVLSGVRLFETDGSSLFSRDLTEVLRRADVVLNLAVPDLANLPRGDAMELDEAILSVCARQNPTAFHVVFSSRAVYAPSSAPLSEESLVLPVSDYGRFKLRQETLYRAHAEQHRTSLLILRGANIYGPSRNFARKSTFLCTMLRDLKSCGRISFDIAETERKDFLFVDDFLTFFERLASFPLHGVKTFNVGSGETISVREIIDVARRWLPELTVRMLPVRREDSFCLDISQARAVLGWSPQVKFSDGFARLVQSLDSNHD